MMVKLLIYHTGMCIKGPESWWIAKSITPQLVRLLQILQSTNFQVLWFLQSSIYIFTVQGDCFDSWTLLVLFSNSRKMKNYLMHGVLPPQSFLHLYWVANIPFSNSLATDLDCPCMVYPIHTFSYSLPLKFVQILVSSCSFVHS